MLKLSRCLSLLILLTTFQVSAQDYTLKGPKELYVSIGNSIEIVSKDCKKYNLTIDSGRIDKGEADCKYLVFPYPTIDSTYHVKITVKDDAGNAVGQHDYRIKFVNISVGFGGYYEFIDTPERLLYGGKLHLGSNDSNFQNINQAPYKITGELVIVKGDKVLRIPIYQETYKGFSQEIRNNFEGLKSGDFIFFHKLKVVILERDEFELNDIFLPIKSPN
jgi:hypothetical protein